MQNIEERVRLLEQLMSTHQHSGFDTTQNLRFQDSQQLGRIQLASSATSMSVTVPSKNFLRIFVQWGAKSGASNDFLRFNSDSGNNYTTTAGVSQAQIDLRNAANSALGGFSIIEIANNISSQVKPAFIHTVSRITSASTAISSFALFASWVNTTAFITSISLVSSNGETYPVNSSMVVLSSKE